MSSSLEVARSAVHITEVHGAHTVRSCAAVHCARALNGARALAKVRSEWCTGCARERPARERLERKEANAERGAGNPLSGMNRYPYLSKTGGCVSYLIPTQHTPLYRYGTHATCNT